MRPGGLYTRSRVSTVTPLTFGVRLLKFGHFVEGGGSSWAVTRLHTMIGLTGYRTRDFLRIRRALNRLTEKA
jgi:hypothetical protein